MTNPLKSSAARQLGLLFPRITMGPIFLLAGISKISNGVEGFVGKYTGALPGFLPRPIGQTYLYAVPFLEILVGACLIFGFITRWAGFVGTVMLVTFTVAVTHLFVNDNYLQPHPNVVYIAVTLLAMLLGPGAISVDQKVFGAQGE